MHWWHFYTVYSVKYFRVGSKTIYTIENLAKICFGFISHVFQHTKYISHMVCNQAWYRNLKSLKFVKDENTLLCIQVITLDFSLTKNSTYNVIELDCKRSSVISVQGLTSPGGSIARLPRRWEQRLPRRRGSWEGTGTVGWTTTSTIGGATGERQVKHKQWTGLRIISSLLGVDPAGFLLLGMGGTDVSYACCINISF